MTIGIGVIGTGWIGEEHVRRLTHLVSGAKVAAVTDIDLQRAAEVAGIAGAEVVDSAEKLIDGPAVDAVVVTSWGPVHAEQVLACIKAGKSVFCEKPLTTDAADGLRVMEAEQAFGRRLVQVGFMRRYDPGYREMKDVIDAGRIGVPLMAHCVHRNPSVRESYHSAMAAQDTAVHEIDTLRWLLADEFTSVQVLTPRKTSKRFEHLQDPQMLLLETAAGARVDVEVFVNCQYGYDIQCEVVGETGTVRLPDPARAGIRTAATSGYGIVQEFKDRFTVAFDVELQEWIDAVANEEEPTGPSSWDGYAATVVTNAAVQALDSGLIVPVDLPERPSFYA
ncbi:Gfo/Idh/MocA family oxidoreductase [Glycomyces sp. L485]|uniref:Gfo/Idh/MocA family protein n=1 Tax=Glycomyces sp. L485 TaxID=2909235 RepID=UPI001F4A7C05|nr:Gfo/Idh/MocA family oxidoreductase [Glycomyces sp. L485]MCH7230074.1 Gfo/Idh/MocA family oxidoreductase [Glycomyces sp. L485]